MSKPKEVACKGIEVIEFSPPSSEGEGTQTKDPRLTRKSDSSRNDEPLVNGNMKLMIVKVELMVASLGKKGILTTLLDSGCTQCLVSPNLVERLGIRLYELKVSIVFT